MPPPTGARVNDADSWMFVLSITDCFRMNLPTNCLPKSYSWWNLNLNVSDAPWLSSAIRYHILVSTTNLLVPTTYSRLFSRYTRKLYQSSSYPSTQYTLSRIDGLPNYQPKVVISRTSHEQKVSRAAAERRPRKERTEEGHAASPPPWHCFGVAQREAVEENVPLYLQRGRGTFPIGIIVNNSCS